MRSLHSKIPIASHRIHRYHWTLSLCVSHSLFFTLHVMAFLHIFHRYTYKLHTMALSSRGWHGMPVCMADSWLFFFYFYFHFASCVRAFSSSLSCRLFVISYSVSVAARESNSNGDFVLKVTLFCQKWFYSHFILNDIPWLYTEADCTSSYARIFIQFCDSYTCPTMIHLVTDCRQIHKFIYIYRSFGLFIFVFFDLIVPCANPWAKSTIFIFTFSAE